MTPHDRDELRRFRAKYPGLTFAQLGRLFGVNAHDAAAACTRDPKKALRGEARDQVLRVLVAHGFTPSEIAAAMGMTPAAVHPHLRRLAA